MTKSVLAISAHPDDIEIFMGGTFLLLGKEGYELHYMSVANGSCGSTTLDCFSTAALRRDEAKRAAARAEAVYHESLADDCQVFYEPRLLQQMAAVVRDVRPEIILTHAPECYQEDHTNTSRLAVAAAFARAMRNFVTSPRRDPYGGEVTVYHAQPHFNRDQLGNVVRPGIFVDVGAVIEDKLAMLAEHQSQRDWLDRTQGMDSYLEAVRSFAKEVGEMSGKFELAEGWRKHMHAGFCSEKANPLADALADGCLVAKKSD